MAATLNKGGFFEVVTRFKRGIYESIVPYDFLCSQYGGKTHSMEALHGIIWMIISRAGAGVTVGPSSAEHECSSKGWANDAVVSKGKGCTVEALRDGVYNMENKLRTEGGKHDAGDGRSTHGGGGRKKDAEPKFCAMTCAAAAYDGDVRLSPLAPSNYQRTCRAVQALATVLAGATNYADAFFDFLAGGTEDALILKRLRFYLIATCDLPRDKDKGKKNRFCVNLCESRAQIEKAVKRAYTEALKRHTSWVAVDPTTRQLPANFFDLYVSDAKAKILAARRAAAAPAAAPRPKKKKRTRRAPAPAAAPAPSPPDLRELMWKPAVDLLRQRILHDDKPESDSSGDEDSGGDGFIDAQSTASPPLADDDSDDAAQLRLSPDELKSRITNLRACLGDLQGHFSAAVASDDDDDRGLQLTERVAGVVDELELHLKSDDGADNYDSADDDDAPPPPPPAPAGGGESSDDDVPPDDDDDDDDDDEDMSPPQPPPQAPKARKRARATSPPKQPPGNAKAPNPSPAKKLFAKKRAQTAKKKGPPRRR